MAGKKSVKSVEAKISEIETCIYELANAIKTLNENNRTLTDQLNIAMKSTTHVQTHEDRLPSSSGAVPSTSYSMYQ